MLEKLAQSERLRKLVPAYWAQYGPKSNVYFRGRKREVIRASYDSEEAMRQGCPLAQLGFNNAIHDDVKWLDAELAKHGGFARFLHDDGYAFAPEDVLFKLVAEFEQRIAPPFVPPADCPADISAEIIADGDFADLIPREVDDATQTLFASFGPMHTIGSELTDRE